MLDLKFIREHTDLVKQGIKAKREVDNLDEIISLDEQRRLFIQEGETLKAKRNEVSAKIGQMKKAQQDTSDAIAEMNEVKDRIQAIDEELKVVQERVDALLLTVPNIPHSSVPVGATPLDNKEIFSWGKKLSVDFELKPHWDLAEKLGIIDFVRGAKVAGGGFPFYVGKGAVLERALINFFLDQAAERGYKEISAPLVVNEESARGTGQIPDKEDLMYAAERDGFI